MTDIQPAPPPPFCPRLTSGFFTSSELLCLCLSYQICHQHVEDPVFLEHCLFWPSLSLLLGSSGDVHIREPNLSQRVLSRLPWTYCVSSPHDCNQLEAPQQPVGARKGAEKKEPPKVHEDAPTIVYCLRLVRPSMDGPWAVNSDPGIHQEQIGRGWSKASRCIV